MNKEQNILMGSECKHDSRHRHRWEFLGVTTSNYSYGIIKIHQCSQCKKIIEEVLSELV